MSSMELTEPDAEWAKDLDAQDRTYRALRQPWAWDDVKLWLVRDGEVGHVEFAVLTPVPTVHGHDGPIRTHNYNDLDQLVEAGWRLDDE